MIFGRAPHMVIQRGGYVVFDPELFAAAGVAATNQNRTQKSLSGAKGQMWFIGN